MDRVDNHRDHRMLTASSQLALRWSSPITLVTAPAAKDVYEFTTMASRCFRAMSCSCRLKIQVTPKVTVSANRSTALAVVAADPTSVFVNDDIGLSP